MVGNGVMNYTDFSMNDASTAFLAKHQFFGKDLADIWLNEC